MDEWNGGAKPRYDALDGVRAAAILAGVYYHAILFASMGRGRMPMVGVAEGASEVLQEYLHSFRMPLFFLISGFFSRMMLGKYGTRGYLARRWSKIGLPLGVGLLTVVPLHQWMKPESISPPVSSRAVADTRGGDVGGKAVGSSVGSAESGSLAGGLHLSDRIFGPASRLFRLEFLWFLWYLLVFATAAPWLTRIPGRFFPGLSRRDRARIGGGWGVRRLVLMPLALGLIGGLAQRLAPTSFGWSLPLASGIFRGVPDFLLHAEPDMPFYLAYFLAGWRLHLEREALPDIGRAWWPYLLAGLGAHAASMAMQAGLAREGGIDPAPIRLAGLLLYGVGSAFTTFGFIGLFRRFGNRPSRVGRYLADTALWVYLVHMPLLTPCLAAITPMGLPWWAEGALVSALDTAAALAIFEAVVRPTPLARLFAPGASPRGPSRTVAPAVAWR